MRTLSENCPNLQVLILKDCRGLSAASISFALHRAHHLRVLDVSSLDTVKDTTMALTCLPKVEKLNISWCRNMTGPGLLPIIQSCSNTLRFLKLNGCPQLDDTTMATLGHHLPNLSHLSMAACTSITDTGLALFLKNSGCKKLTHLNLSNCARLTDISLRQLSQLTTLTHLELAGCVLMTDQGFCYMCPRLRTLVHLDLEDLQQITGITVRAVANHQSQLRRLCLSNCTQITDDAINHLVVHGVCNQLQHIELDNCTVTDEILVSIAGYLQQQQRRPSASTDSNISFFSQECESRKINLEVLDCTNITELGIREALAKAGSLLTIKSFYSFQKEEDEVDSPLIGRTGRYTSVARRRTAAGRANGQTHAAANCIIL